MSETVGPGRPEEPAGVPGEGEAASRGWLDPILVLWALAVIAGFVWERIAGSQTFAHLRHVLPGG